MNTANVSKTDNMPAIVKLFHDLVAAEKKMEGLGRDIVLDLFENAATVNLDKLAVGSKDQINTAARAEWLKSNLTEQADDIAAKEALKHPGKGASVEEAIQWRAENDEINRRMEARRSAFNRGVAAAYFMTAHNADNVRFTGSRKNKTMFVFEQDAVDTKVTAPVLDKDGKIVPVARVERTYTMGDLVMKGEACILAHQAHAEKKGEPVATPKPRAGGKRKQSAAGDTAADRAREVMPAKSIIETAQSMATSLVSLTSAADRETVFGKSDAVDNMVATSIAERFGTRNASGTVVELDVSKLLTWMVTQTMFKPDHVKLVNLPPVVTAPVIKAGTKEHAAAKAGASTPRKAAAVK